LFPVDAADFFAFRAIFEDFANIGSLFHIVSIVALEFGVIGLEDLELQNLLNLFVTDLALLILPRFLSETNDSQEELDELGFQITTASEIHRNSRYQRDSIDEMLVDYGHVILYDEHKDLIHNDRVHELLGLTF
jgi:hypothetical protein